MEKRKSERFPIYCPIKYKSIDSRSKNPAITLNISEGGALISSEKSINTAAKVMINIFLKDENFNLDSKVVHVKPGMNNGPHAMGVEFLGKPANFTRKLYETVQTIGLFRDKLSEKEKRGISLAEASMKWYR